MTRARLMIAIAVALALAIAIRFTLTSDAPQRSLPLLDSLGGNFELPSTLGKRLALSDLRGKVVLVTFGFTHCPDVCPTVMARIRAVLLDLGAEAKQVQPLLITVDPERDTLEVLAKYVGQFHPSIVGMTGTDAELAAVLKQFKAHSEKIRSDTAINPAQPYSFAHSGHIYLIDRHGRVRATFAESAAVSDMSRDLRRVLIEPR